MDSNLIDDKIVSFKVLDGLGIDSCILEINGTGCSGFIEDNLVDTLREVKIEVGLVLVIEL